MSDCVLEEESADYDTGAEARLDDFPVDLKASTCWQLGWGDIDRVLRITCVGTRQATRQSYKPIAEYAAHFRCSL
jgi:hypothetical protein